MKKVYFLLIFLFIDIVANSVDVGKLSKKIDSINQKSNKLLKIDYDVYDPFARAKPLVNKKSRKKIIYTRAIKIQTILNNRVLISGKWFSKGDTVYNAKIKEIKKSSILILRDGKWTTLHLKNRKSIIKTKEVLK